MKFNITCVYLLMGASILFSCKKDKDDPSPSNPTVSNNAPQRTIPLRDTLQYSKFERSVSYIVDFSSYFTDIDNDEWSISNVSSVSGNTNVRLQDFDINNKIVGFETYNKTGTEQSIQLSITITDARGLASTFLYELIIDDNNTAPELISTIPLHYFFPSSSASITLNDYFSDPENDSWTVVSSEADDTHTSAHSYSNLPSMMPGSMGQIIKAVSFQTGNANVSSSLTVTLRDEFGAEYSISIPIEITNI